jgi:hypothetical protein
MLCCAVLCCGVVWCGTWGCATHSCMCAVVPSCEAALIHFTPPLPPTHTHARAHTHLRPQVTDFLGSAAFSQAVQALDTATGGLVCLKIIKNNKVCVCVCVCARACGMSHHTHIITRVARHTLSHPSPRHIASHLVTLCHKLQDYFDQSLDEIKLLRYVNAADPDDEHNIVRLYDFFYYKVRAPGLVCGCGWVGGWCVRAHVAVSVATSTPSRAVAYDGRAAGAVCLHLCVYVSLCVLFCVLSVATPQAADQSTHAHPPITTHTHTRIPAGAPHPGV